jgi:hypothetical protein
MQESNLLKLLITGDKYNITLFKELVKVEYELSERTCDKIVTQFYFKGDWANYVYVFNDDHVMCSRDKMIIQDEVLDDCNRNIVCFIKE